MAVVIQASSLQCLRLDLHPEAQVTAQLNSQDTTLPTSHWEPQEARDTQLLLPSWPTHQLPQETQTPHQHISALADLDKQACCRHTACGVSGRGQQGSEGVRPGQGCGPVTDGHSRPAPPSVSTSPKLSLKGPSCSGSTCPGKS